MNDENIILCDVAMLLNRSKSVKYKESIIRSERSLAGFLYKNGLLVDLNPFNEDGELKLDLVIRKRNVTDTPPVGLGPLDAGSGIVCGVDVAMPLSLGVVADNGRVGN